MSKDGLPTNHITALCRDASGVLWIGTENSGVCYYDGRTFVTLTMWDGLIDNHVRSVLSDRDGNLWVATDAGVSCSDGETFVNFLQQIVIKSIYQQTDDTIWFGTEDKGVYRYTNDTLTNFTPEEGLADVEITSIQPDADGTIWLGTAGGLTRYQRSFRPPGVRIVSAKPDLDSRTSIFAHTRITIEYSAIDFRTHPRKRQYRYRFTEASEVVPPFGPPTANTVFETTPEKPGEYTFEVQAIDRDLNYSEPASLTLTVAPEPHGEALRQTRAELEEAYRNLADRNAELE